jgi:single-stranded-DNA-specific exonuclease
MKERHIRLELLQESGPASSRAAANAGGSPIRAVGWDLAARVAELALNAGSLVDVVYRIRENDHPEYGGLEAEICDIRHAQA